MKRKPLADFTRDELTRLERAILWIQDSIGHHFPWCDALIPDQQQPCSCGMDAMRANRAFIMRERIRRGDAA
jgi:hypothetical protein